MKQTVRRVLQNVLLALLGGALLKIASDGTYLRYVKPEHLWPLVACGRGGSRPAGRRPVGS